MVASVLAGACSVGSTLRPAAASAESLPLVWHVETDDGNIFDSNEADATVNPASVTKLATSLRALDTLGADHRFTTRFLLTGADVPEYGVHNGSLVVEGGGDPDFHFENAIVVGRAIEQAGLQRVSGDLFVTSTFWIGWERGTAGRQPDPVRRCLDMGRRLQQAWTPGSWDEASRKAWMELASRRGWDSKAPPVVTIDGRVRCDKAPFARTLLEHRSEPLLVALRRFNVFSNNDIERLDESIGPPAGLSAFLTKRLGPEASRTSFATSSGLNANRISPRVVVHLLRDLRGWLAAHGHEPGDLMPVLGCGKSTLTELFPRLRQSGEADGMAGKTGTLNLQDGGVCALAGFLPAGPGLMFFVAAPGSGAHLPKARAAEEDFVRGVLMKSGPVGPLHCPPPVPTSDAEAEMSVPKLVSRR